jgi:beta-mannosidase
VYDAVKSVYTRVLISLERDAAPYVLGREKVYKRGTTFTAKVWVTNDHPHPIYRADVAWRIVGVDTDQVVSGNRFVTTLPADSVEEADQIAWSIPATARPGTYRVTMRVLGSDGQPLSANAADIVVR